MSATFASPADAIWGFHVHQEVPEGLFGRALAVQKACKAFLEGQRGIRVDHDEAVSPGYGPHLDFMWELRVESLRCSERGDVLRELGQSIAWLCVNRLGLPSYVHPTMHDPSLPVLEMLKDEGRTNQAQAMWFGERVPQLRDFFFNPPLAPVGPGEVPGSNGIVDTRSSRVIAAQTKAAMVELMDATCFLHPKDVVIRGYHIHVDWPDDEGRTPELNAFALLLFDGLVSYLLSQGSRPSSTRLYEPLENGPHQNRGWEVKFEYRDFDTATRCLGHAVGWLMCNRGTELPVFVHCVTWEEGDHVEELRAHRDCAAFIGDAPPPLDLTFFERLKKRSDFVAAAKARGQLE
jgi:aromatic ring-cleaving dioxygenase